MRLAVVITILVLCGVGCRNTVSLVDPPPEQWAVRLEGKGFENFIVFKQAEGFYRGAQADAQQFKALHDLLGIRTVINVRRTRTSEKIVETLGMNYVLIPIAAWSLEEEHAVEFLKIMKDPANHPVFLYCHFGGDRSNALAAIYRMAVQGWCSDEAIREMTEGGNYFHPIWQNLIRTVRDIDIERVRALAGLHGIPPQSCSCQACAS